MKKNIFSLTVFMLMAFAIYSQSNQWAWMKGDSSANNTTLGIYGTQGIPDAANKPGDRELASTWTDASGNFWLFGGLGYSSTNYGYLNDLWKYNPATNQWTWVKGDNTGSNTGIYGTLGTSAATNKPGGRKGAVTWIDGSGNFWLFAGNGYGSTTSSGSLNDLWKYNPSINQWTWVKGDNTIDNAGVYGTLGTAATANKPGARNNSVTWRDASGNFWLFGGYGYVSTNYGYLNDLWKYNPSTNQWTWVKGDNTLNNTGVYGAQGTSAAANKPGARYSSVSWIDASGNLWLFGGEGLSSSSYGSLNDLWKYNSSTNQWTWVKGDNTINNAGVYGTQGTPAATNKPDARSGSSSWIDASGNLWLFGGYYYNSTTYLSSYFNDLWRYNPSTNQWTWTKGDNTPNNPGNYGVQGTPLSSNKPGARNNCVGWSDLSGNFWLFGGLGNGYLNYFGSLKELWKYNPVSDQWTWVKDFTLLGYTGVYGTQGLTDGANKPGGRDGAVTWTDSNGDFWMFGGNGYSGTNSTGLLNDLWRYNSSTNLWTWIKGDTTLNNQGIYGTINIAANANKPGARSGASGWIDGAGNLWLFGGDGYATATTTGRLNDLWKYNPSANQWTWVKGDNVIDISSDAFGSIGVYAAGNKPGARTLFANWRDQSGNFWLFGGNKYYTGCCEAWVNDLWKFNPTTNQWACMRNDDLDSSAYGTQGVASSTNKPGDRYGSSSWTDANGNFWLFGGYGKGWAGAGYIPYTTDGLLNDLWKYDVSTNQWVWINGDKFVEQETIYNTQGIFSASNKPGGRNFAKNWTDQNGNLWLLGGTGYSYYYSGSLNDLWKYDIQANQWAWMKGGNTTYNSGTYGSKGVFSGINKPGSRSGASGWVSQNGNLWLFGGDGYGTVVNSDKLNDLWQYKPCYSSISITPSSGNFCNGVTSISLTAAGGTTYQWYKNGVIIPGITGATYTATSAGSYSVKSVIGDCGDVYSNEVVLGSGAIQPGLGGTGIYCAGDPVNVGIPDTEVDQDYRWRQNGAAVYYYPIGGNGGNQSLNFNMQANRVGTYIVESIKPGCGTVFSNSVYVGFAQINNLMTTNICGSLVTFKWNRVAPVNISQTYYYELSQSSSPVGPGISTTDSAITLASLSPSSTYYIHVRSACRSGYGDWATISFLTPAALPPPVTVVWTGAVNNSWSNSANWQCGQVPVNTTAVIINGGMPNYPAITSNLTLKTLTVNAGASIQVNTGVVITLTGF